MSLKLESNSWRKMSNDLEETVRDLRRRIDELRNQLPPSQPTGTRETQQVVQQRQDLEEAPERKGRDEELNALRDKLRKK